MASERDIQDAERAKLEAIVAEHGTEREQFQLVLSGVMQNGITLGRFEGNEPVGYLAPEPELLARLARRVDRRAKFGLPAVECAGDPPTEHGCSCLERALDEARDHDKRAILKLAAGFHWSPPPRPEPARPEPEPAPTPARQRAVEETPASPGPASKPEPTPEPTPGSSIGRASGTTASPNRSAT